MSGQPYVSRAGEKLAAALDFFAVDATDRICVDLGSHVGGFVDCLLRRGAARVYAVDPGYGVLAWTLRRDARVVVCERQNALQYQCPEPASLVTIDVGWTAQRLVLPAAVRQRGSARSSADIISLIKPHYEADRALLRRGVLPDDQQEAVLAQVRSDVAALGLAIRAEMESPIRGSGGNREWLWRIGTATE